MLKKSDKRIPSRWNSIGFALSNASQGIGHVIGQFLEPIRIFLYLLFIFPIKFFGKIFGTGDSKGRASKSLTPDGKESEQYFWETRKIRWQMMLEGEFGQFIKTLLAIITLPFWLPWRIIKILVRPRDNGTNF